MTKIKRTAKKYIKAIKKCSHSSVIHYLESLGYKVVFFNTPLGNELVKAYGLEWESDIRKSFTCYEEKTVATVFVDDKQHSTDKLLLLLHETGHILLGHIGNNPNEYCDEISSDIDADAFVYEVMNYKSNTPKLLSLVAGIIISIISGFAIGDYIDINYTSNVVQTLPDTYYTSDVVQTQPQTTYEDNTHSQVVEGPNEMVYITPSGTKYHLKDCRYVKNHTDCTKLTKEQAHKTHTPCKVCNP